MSTKAFDGFRCQVKFLNSSPVRIVRTLAVFTYDDGTTSSDPPSGEPGEVNIGPSEAGYRFSQDKCVTSVYAFVLTDTAGSVDSSQSAPSGYCLIAPVFELVPRTAVAKGAIAVYSGKQLAEGQSSPLLELCNGHAII